MPGSNRRDALRLALGAALLPLFATRPALASANPMVDQIAPPPGQMIYRRSIERQLPGGPTLAISRDFAVEFERLDTGFRVTGEQVAARVDWPAPLEHLAALERQRVENGVFPMLLDEVGHIVEGPEAASGEELSRALADVRAMMAGAGEEASTLVEALHQSGTRLTTHLPRDLFAPLADERSAREEVILPWGDAGEIETRFTALRDPASRLMSSARREITTRIGNDERRSGEQWELFCIDQATA
ncbi:hypothetical protein M3P36_02820 [Altererythrobacter sp. KTW20L]|uniref:hypothetical protein n=1 Tax=Altererythrobacter sp. KTW20L TaxID=2942210 RepID=UPI0020BF230B|nr:hypothetical protein [Altererythrobacter sp. KTW20L]MCL6249984.1 hypothetical protein [Altererythrobacter sp. KTW20L]